MNEFEKNYEEMNVGYNICPHCGRYSVATMEGYDTYRVGCTYTNYIFSWETYRSYLKHSCYFVQWCKEQPIDPALGHKPRTLEECRIFAERWVQSTMDRGFSSYTVKLEVAALAKLYSCKSTDFDIKTPPRNRVNIKRIRITTIGLPARNRLRCNTNSFSKCFLCSSISPTQFAYFFPKSSCITYDDIAFDKLAVEIIGKTQTAQLRKMANVSFKRHPSLNFDEDRLQKIEGFVKRRAIGLLVLDKTRSAKKKRYKMTDVDVGQL